MTPALGRPLFFKRQSLACTFLPIRLAVIEPLAFLLFTVTCAHLKTSNYTLELPNELNHFPTFHSLLLWPFLPNDDELFKSRRLAQPGPVLTPDGQQEWLVRAIIDERICGHGMQYLV